MDISKRLKTIASLADEPVVADIGCDHALVCIEAVLNGKVKKAYACDLRPGPLRQAQANIEANGLTDQIEVRLQDGITDLPAHTRQIIIAGMGGKLIEQILSSLLPQDTQSLLLSAHKDVEHLRAFLLEKGWKIDQEWTVFDQRYYTIIKAVISKDQNQPESIARKHRNHLLEDKESMLLGFHPKTDQTYLDYLDYLENKWQKIRSQMPEEAAGTMDDKLQLVQKRRIRLQKPAAETAKSAQTD